MLLLLFPTAEPSITRDADAYSTTGGVDVVVAWSGAEDPATKIVIALEGADVDDFVDWVYTDGTQVEPGSVVGVGSHSFTVPSTTGTYVARMILEDGAAVPITPYSLWNTGSTFPYAYASETMSGDCSMFVVHGRDTEETMAGFVDGAGTGSDYSDIKAGLYFNAGTLYKIENGSVTSLATACTTGDMFEIRRTVGSGVIEIFRKVAGGTSFSSLVTLSVTSTAALRPKMVARFSNEIVTCWVVDAGSNAALTWTTSGSCSVTQIGLSTDAASYAVGAPITVSFTGGRQVNDWISLSPETSAWGSFSTWNYLNDTQVAPGSPVASGTVTFTAPSAGSYVVRLQFNDLVKAVFQSATFTTV